MTLTISFTIKWKLCLIVTIHFFLRVYSYHFLVVKRTSKSSMKILLNLGYFKANTSIIRDEIHLFMDSSRRQDMKPFKPYILRFKDIHTGQLIRKFKVPAFNQGWQVLSLNKWTNKWVKDPNSNKGIILSVFRGGRGRPAVKNPFVNFPRGNGPYMILFASESVQSLLAWRFLIQNALNSVAGHTSGQTRKTRDVRRVSRGLSQQSTSGQQLAQNSSLHLLQQPQCKGVEKDMNLTNLTSGDVVIIQPKVYKSLNCPKSCIHRTVGQPSNSSQNNTGVTMVKHCCTPTQHRTLMVLLKNTTTGDIEAQVYQRFVPTACEWLR